MKNNRSVPGDEAVRCARPLNTVGQPRVPVLLLLVARNTAVLHQVQANKYNNKNWSRRWAILFTELLKSRPVQVLGFNIGAHG